MQLPLLIAALKNVFYLISSLLKRFHHYLNEF